MIRFDGPHGRTTAPPPWATFASLRAAVSLAVKRARLTVASDAIGERVIAWGGRFEVDPVSAWATKNAVGAGTVDRTIYERKDGRWEGAAGC